MTAEIGIINQRGLALAADSAITITRADKDHPITFNNATKLFTLSKANKVGFMIYQDANFMGVPWSVIINAYKEYVGENVMPHLEDYVKDFFTFLNQMNIYTESSEKEFVLNYAFAIINTLQAKNVQTIDELENALYDTEQEANEKTLIDLDLDDFFKKYSNDIQQIFLNTYNNVNDGKIISHFVNTVADVIASSQTTESYTGLVIGGYGDEDIFPTIIQLKVSGRFNGQIKYEVILKDKADPTYLDEEVGVNSAIIPFAQHEMVNTVINGIDPTLELAVKQSLADIMSNLYNRINKSFEPGEKVDELNDYIEQLVNRKYNDLIKYIQTNYTSPIISMLQNFSIKELGEMANTLVSLTSFKRKYSGDIRTVGGPVKVLLISKEDGVKWMNNNTDKEE